MGEAMLLEFDGVDIGHQDSKDPMFMDAVEEGLLLHTEDSGNQIGSVIRHLPRKQLPLDLLPLWICHHCQKYLKNRASDIESWEHWVMLQGPPIYDDSRNTRSPISFRSTLSGS